MCICLIMYIYMCVIRKGLMMVLNIFYTRIFYWIERHSFPHTISCISSLMNITRRKYSLNCKVEVNMLSEKTFSTSNDSIFLMCINSDWWRNNYCIIDVFIKYESTKIFEYIWIFFECCVTLITLTNTQ